MIFCQERSSRQKPTDKPLAHFGRILKRSADKRAQETSIGRRSSIYAYVLQRKRICQIQPKTPMKAHTPPRRRLIPCRVARRSLFNDDLWLRKQARNAGAMKRRLMRAFSREACPTPLNSATKNPALSAIFPYNIIY